MHLRAIIDDLPDDFDYFRDTDYLLTFECDDQRYQRTLGDCDIEHVNALHEPSARGPRKCTTSCVNNRVPKQL
jgi:hypothetical protein